MGTPEDSILNCCWCVHEWKFSEGMLLIFYSVYMFIVYLCSLYVNLLFCVYSRIFCSYGNITGWNIYRHPFGPWTGRDLFYATFGMTCWSRLKVFFFFFSFVSSEGQLPKLSCLLICKRYWWSILSLGLIEKTFHMINLAAKCHVKKESTSQFLLMHFSFQ